MRKIKQFIVRILRCIWPEKHMALQRHITMICRGAMGTKRGRMWLDGYMPWNGVHDDVPAIEVLNCDNETHYRVLYDEAGNKL